MLKRTQRIDALRNIRKQFVSFLSIAIVIAMGVGIYMACTDGAVSIERRGDEYYRSVNYHDFDIRSTRGITEDDIREVKKVDGIVDAEGVFGVDMVIEGAKGKSIAHVSSIAERMDQITIRSGKLPQKTNECAIAEELVDTLQVGVGDTVLLYAQDESAYLKEKSFRVSAIIQHPNHFRVGLPSVYDVVVPYDAFDKEGLGIDYTGMLVRADTDGVGTFTDAYREKIDDLYLSLIALGKERSAVRDEEIKAEAEEKIAEGEDELSEGRELLNEGHAEIDENKEVLADARDQLDAARKELEDGKAQIGSSEEELEAGKKKLEAGKEKLDDAKAQLDAGRAQLDSAKAQLSAGADRLQTSKAQLDAAADELDAGAAELDDARTQLEIGRAQLDAAEARVDDYTDRINVVIEDVWNDNWGTVPAIPSVRQISDNFTLTMDEMLRRYLPMVGFSASRVEEILSALHRTQTYTELASEYDRLPEGEKSYADGLAQYEAGLAEWNAGKAQYDEGLAQYEEGLATYNESYMQYQLGENEYNSSLALYQANLATYEDSLAQYEEGLAKLEEGKETLSSGEKELSEKEAEYEDGAKQLEEGEATLSEKEAEYEEGVATLEDAKAQLAEYSAGHWVIMMRHLNTSWIDMRTSAVSLKRISLSFALLFVFLAVLVCYATISKIIDEQRKLVGTTKALGFYTKEIFGKYLLFGASAAVIGSILGVLLSYTILQSIFLKEVGGMFSIGGLSRIFRIGPSLIALILSVAVAAAATWIACRRLLARPATRLMSGEIPQGVFKEKRGDGQKKRSVYTSLILRNIRMDWKRVIVTIISIAGSCVLLVVGFSLQRSFQNLVTRQWQETVSYDAIVRYLPDLDPDARGELRDTLTENNTSFLSTYMTGTVLRIGRSLEVGELVVADPDALMRFYRLQDFSTKNEMRIPDAGIVLFNRIAEVYGLGVGDHISVLDESGVFHDVPVTGLCTSYAGRTCYMSAEYAREIFGEALLDNSFAVRTLGADEAAIVNDMDGTEGFVSYTASGEEKLKYQMLAESLKAVIWVMIVIAGIMAFIVQLNLLRIQINQKKRELTIMRVNGFTTRETIGYVLRENAVTTVMGVIVGLILGNVMTQIALRSIERMDLMMIREINIPSCVYAVLITVFFALVVNYLALRGVKDLKLSDVND